MRDAGRSFLGGLFRLAGRIEDAVLAILISAMVLLGATQIFSRNVLGQGFGWADETIDPKTRSMINLSMLAGLGKIDEFEIHLRGAINNGVTKKEMLEIFLHVATYAGAPALLDGVRIARKVWAKHEKAGIA